jgi:hypothetical protein
MAFVDHNGKRLSVLRRLAPARPYPLARHLPAAPAVAGAEALEHEFEQGSVWAVCTIPVR